MANPPYVLEAIRSSAQTTTDTGTSDHLVCWGIIDTGATQTTVDLKKIAQALNLRKLDERVLHFAGSQRRYRADQYWASLAFPDFDIPERTGKILALDLAEPFYVLIGMDALEGTRFTYHGGERWFSWERLDEP